MRVRCYSTDLAAREVTRGWNICCGRPPCEWGHLMAAEIGRTASKHQSSECGKATSLSSLGGDVGLENQVIVATESEQQQSQQQSHYQQRQSSPPPPSPQQQQQQQQHPHERTSSATTIQPKKTLVKTTITTSTTPPCRNRKQFATAPTLGINQQQQTPTTDVTSTAEAVTEVPGAIKTTINIGFAMNHVNDQENLKQLSLAPVQVNEVEEMDTQEGECAFSISLFLYSLPSISIPPSPSLPLLSLSLTLSLFLSLFFRIMDIDAHFWRKKKILFLCYTPLVTFL